MSNYKLLKTMTKFEGIPDCFREKTIYKHFTIYYLLFTSRSRPGYKDENTREMFGCLYVKIFLN